MSLSKGTGPFGEDRTNVGDYRIESPKHILHLDPSPKRVRGSFAGQAIVDSTDAVLLHETGHLPVAPRLRPLPVRRSQHRSPRSETGRCQQAAGRSLV